MNITVGSYEAKTTLPAMLRGVQAGNCYTITRHGEPIALLVPVQSNKKSADAVTAVDRMLQFMQTRPAVSVSVRGLIEEGRA